MAVHGDIKQCCEECGTACPGSLTLLHSERPKLYTIVYNFGLSECNRVKKYCVVM